MSDSKEVVKGGRVSTKDYLIRLKKISDLVDQGKTTSQICDELELSKHIVDKSRRHLKSLSVADLTKEDIANKRSELYLELEEVEAETRESIDKLKLEKNPKYATIKTYLELWKGIVESKARMFGVLEIKSEGLTINQQINAPVIKDKISAAARERISKLLIDDHESNA